MEAENSFVFTVSIYDVAHIPMEREDAVWRALSPIFESALKYASLVAARAETHINIIGF